ncbi:hypothetical protein LZ30DRAFT_178143 [Colletotrichum cereale]|nr:hypothetical protein LZ30DRAFT_178143 [Colletotrichum cereale]
MDISAVGWSHCGIMRNRVGCRRSRGYLCWRGIRRGGNVLSFIPPPTTVSWRYHRPRDETWESLKLTSHPTTWRSLLEARGCAGLHHLCVVAGRLRRQHASVLRYFDRIRSASGSLMTWCDGQRPDLPGPTWRRPVCSRRKAGQSQAAVASGRLVMMGVGPETSWSRAQAGRQRTLGMPWTRSCTSIQMMRPCS